MKLPAHPNPLEIYPTNTSHIDPEHGLMKNAGIKLDKTNSDFRVLVSESDSWKVTLSRGDRYQFVVEIRHEENKQYVSLPTTRRYVC